MAKIGFALFRHAAPACQIEPAQVRQRSQKALPTLHELFDDERRVTGGRMLIPMRVGCHSSNKAMASATSRISAVKGLPKIVLRSTLRVLAGMRQPLMRFSWMLCRSMMGWSLREQGAPHHTEREPPLNFRQAP